MTSIRIGVYPAHDFSQTGSGNRKRMPNNKSSFSHFCLKVLYTDEKSSLVVHN